MRQPSAIYSNGGLSKQQICWRRPLPNKLVFVGLASCRLPLEVCADMDAISNVVIARLKVCCACGNDRLRPMRLEVAQALLLFEVALQREILVIKNRQTKPIKFLQTRARGLPAEACVTVLHFAPVVSSRSADFISVLALDLPCSAAA